MLDSKTFYLKFDSNWFDKGDIITFDPKNDIRVEVLEDPHKKWYKLLIQYITFGLYKAPTQYKCKIL